MFKRSNIRFFSELGQDKFVFENFFRGKHDGVFVDVGAYDGEKFSNSLFFERYLGWTGICVEPVLSAFEKLSESRTAHCFNCCVSDHEGEGRFLDIDVPIDEKMLSGLLENYDARHLKRIDGLPGRRDVSACRVTTLPALLKQCGITKVDYCSIDASGSELKILQSLDFQSFDIAVLSIDNTYRQAAIQRVMEDRGYTLAGVFDGRDELYVKNCVKWLPQTTAICAVWHADPHRYRMLAAHARNLRSQTRPVDRIYVFDNGDHVPDDLDGTALLADRQMTIYEAWNLALAAVKTPYVLNLNLDDRLATNAVAEMEQTLNHGADLVGGDWKICYSEEETDATSALQPAASLPFALDWPPRPGTLTRLGSGSGHRGTYGPACMWRMSLHGELGRYPWKFGDGTLVRTIADQIWWQMLELAGKKSVRLPFIIGHYYSHPSEQGEFRNPAAVELQRLSRVGIDNE
jgi:FkbM family methyltransferase